MTRGPEYYAPIHNLCTFLEKNISDFHYSDIIISAMASQIIGVLDCLLNRLLIKENIKAPRHWFLCGESTPDQWIPLTKGQ